MLKVKKELIIFLIILAVAIFFRFYQLDLPPPGLWPDEAANGVDALKAIDAKDFKIFYPANNGLEGLFINMQAVSIMLFGAEPWALRLVSAIIGTLTVAGLYLLTKFIFGWHTAALASFFLAISFWHVNFSRIGFRAIMLPFIMVWAFYFLWRGLRNGHLKHFFIAGLVSGIGFYTYFSFRIVPLIAMVLFWNYWTYLKKDFSHARYEYARNQLLRGFALLVLTTIIVALPIGIYFYTHPEDFLKREGRPISIFEQEKPLKELGLSVIRTLAMFNFSGDQNQRHNISGWPELSLPIGILFAVGFLRELAHWLRRKHGHFSPIHTLLFSWFLIMLLPGFLSTEAPHALRTIGVLPVVMIFAAKGFEWFINLVTGIHQISDPHFQFDKKTYRREANLLLTITIVGVLSSMGFWEYSRYFKIWADNPDTANAFVQQYVDISEHLNRLDPKLPKYILVNEGDVIVDGVPNNAQTIKFLTQTHNQKASAKNISYLKDDQIFSERFPAQFIIIPLKSASKIDIMFKQLFGLQSQDKDSFTVYYR